MQNIINKDEIRTRDLKNLKWFLTKRCLPDILAKHPKFFSDLPNLTEDIGIFRIFQDLARIEKTDKTVIIIHDDCYKLSCLFEFFTKFKQIWIIDYYLDSILKGCKTDETIEQLFIIQKSARVDIASRARELYPNAKAMLIATNPSKQFQKEVKSTPLAEVSDTGIWTNSKIYVYGFKALNHVKEIEKVLKMEDEEFRREFDKLKKTIEEVKRKETIAQEEVRTSKDAEDLSRILPPIESKTPLDLSEIPINWGRIETINEPDLLTEALKREMR
jgi:hypothetical protein